MAEGRAWWVLALHGQAGVVPTGEEGLVSMEMSGRATMVRKKRASNI